MSANGVEILLVEDNPNDEMLALYALRGFLVGKHIHVVRDGAEALDFAFCTGAYASRLVVNPQVILLDKNLPVIDGIDVLRRLRADPRTRLIPIVMLTSSSDARGVEESYRLGANSYVVKPVNFDKYTETAQKLGDYWLLINKPPPEQVGQFNLALPGPNSTRMPEHGHGPSLADRRR
jgi:two-component system response regulator